MHTKLNVNADIGRGGEVGNARSVGALHQHLIHRAKSVADITAQPPAQQCAILQLLGIE